MISSGVRWSMTGSAATSAASWTRRLMIMGASRGDEGVGLRLLVERLRREGDAVGADDGSGLGIDRDLREVGGIVQRSQDAGPLLSREVRVARGSVRKQQPQDMVPHHSDSGDNRQVGHAHIPMLSQGLDAEQGLVPPGSLPIRQELIAPEFGPLSDETQSPSIETAGQHFTA